MSRAPSPFPFLDQPHTVAVAHRGGAREFPENTIEAFAGAIDLGYTHIETDAHVTADGIVVAFHDDQLDRVTDSAGAVAERTWSELRSVRIGGTHPIPRLDELLSTFPDVMVNIDPKADDSVQATAAVIRRADAVGRVCVAAFSDRRLRRMRELLGPELCTGMGPREIARLATSVATIWAGPLMRAVCRCPPRTGVARS